MKLAAKLVLIFLAAVTLLTGAAGYLTVRRFSQQFQRTHEQQAVQLADRMNEQLRTALSTQGVEGVDRMIESMPLPTEQIEIRCVIFGSQAAPGERPRAPADMLTTVVAGRVETVTVRTPSGESFLRTYYPLSWGDRLAGLEFSRSRAPVEQARRNTIRTTLIQISLLGAVCGLVILLAGVRMVGRPLDALVAKTHRIAAGDFSEPLRLRGRDELTKLGIALNEMCERLQQQQQTIAAESAARLDTLDQLRHADRLKTVGRLAAGIAHELGTPLNIVSGRAGMIAAGRLSTDEVRHSAAVIKSEADRITSVIRQLLDFARQSTPRRTTADLASVVRQTIDLLDPLAKKRNVEIQVRGGGESLTACIDVGQIQQVLTNILVNAIQAMPGGGEVRIAVSRQAAAAPEQPDAPPRDCYRMDIEDDGPGMPAEDRQQIFEPFFTTKGVGEGTGLGLSIAYGIVQEHGGWIEVASELGQGSCFSIFIPRDFAACREAS